VHPQEVILALTQTHAHASPQGTGLLQLSCNGAAVLSCCRQARPQPPPPQNTPPPPPTHTHPLTLALAPLYSCCILWPVCSPAVLQVYVQAIQEGLSAAESQMVRVRQQMTAATCTDDRDQHQQKRRLSRPVKQRAFCDDIYVLAGQHSSTMNGTSSVNSSNYQAAVAAGADMCSALRTTWAAAAA